jgi:protein-ribulosamine 3-kinase
MSTPITWQAIERAIGEATGKNFRMCRRTPLGGGCISAAYRLEGADVAYFVKLNRRERACMFEAEACGLAEMVATASLRVPRPICHGAADDQAYLVLENLPLGPRHAGTDRLLGQQLAALHRIPQPYYGWHRDNTIGSTPQINSRSRDWVEFWTRQRLGYQLELAARQGYGGALQRQGESLCARLGAFFHAYRPAASLLHGDLWSGNYAADDQGQPVVFDPACYYGDRETDVAMTELFGGFSRDFYASYDERFPLDRGYSVRKNLYNLYHVLNHLNLFGGSYRVQAQTMMGKLLAEVA